MEPFPRGAVIGLVATAAGVFTGLFTIVDGYHQQKLAQATELRKAEGGRTEQLRLQTKMQQAEIDARLAEKDKEIQAEQEKTLQQEAARDDLGEEPPEALGLEGPNVAMDRSFIWSRARGFLDPRLEMRLQGFNKFCLDDSSRRAVTSLPEGSPPR